MKVAVALGKNILAQQIIQEFKRKYMAQEQQL